jgi:hypothetical protein
LVILQLSRNRRSQVASSPVIRDEQARSTAFQRSLIGMVMHRAFLRLRAHLLELPSKT